MKKDQKYIAILGPVGISIPPQKQGGIEWMVYYLAEHLVKRGYPVLLFGPKTTKTSAKLVEVCKQPISKYKKRILGEASRSLRIELSALTQTRIELKKRKNQIGVIFNQTVHGGVFADLEETLNIPVFHTLHLPLYPEIAAIYKKFKSRLVSISNNQRKRFPKLRYLATIYNGIELKRFPFNEKPKDYVLFAGKIRESKNPLAAIKAAQMAGKKLIMAGKISEKRYYETRIKPLLNQNVIHKGEVSLSEMKKLYAGAEAFLFPIQWQEPFGLVMIESMACGTPVIAFPKGSVLEVVRDGKTGFIVESTKQMAKAIKKIRAIKRRDCRQYIKDNFSVEKMVEGYEKLCKKIIT